MFSRRVDPVFILEAFEKGADGVLVAGCQLTACPSQSVDIKINRGIKLLKNY